MDFKPARNKFYQPEVVLTVEELSSIEAMKPEEAKQTLRQMGFELALNNRDISEQEFGLGVISSIGYVATAEKVTEAGDSLIRGFHDGHRYVSAQFTIRGIEANYIFPHASAQEGL